MMVLLAGKVSEADSLLEKGGSVYQAIMLNVIMLRWSRALDLAIKYKSFLEIVMGFRQRYLEKLGREETDEKFLRHKGDVSGNRFRSYSRGDGRSGSSARIEKMITHGRGTIQNNNRSVDSYISVQTTNCQMGTNVQRE
ncbi:hypothetical protein NECAME_12181 [Necator americanus]|uniref:IFT80/172/WDR35 TPR domain-containing protein n=1 Tax=Necator americanus TaxID=51031 RepID=W2T368_NECAM|nr:hypothetical protein NECAME_12181 [Necator americanus]ETN75681.1 hypothetical protein NECAME_12181 [Necator americanus]